MFRKILYAVLTAAAIYIHWMRFVNVFGDDLDVGGNGGDNGSMNVLFVQMVVMY